MRQTPQSELIAMGSKSRDHAVGAKRDIGMMPEFLALVHVRDMGVKNGDRCMGEGSGIDDDARRDLPRLMNPVNDLVFAIGLVKPNLEPEFAGNSAAVRLDIGKGFMPVDVRLTLAKPVQIGAIQDIDEATHRFLQSIGNCSRSASASGQ